jgi:hypothetical protein
MNEADLLNKDIEQYCSLKAYYQGIENRLEALKEKIKSNLIEYQGGTINETVNYTEAPQYKVELRVKKKEPLPEQGEIDQLFIDEGIWSKYKQEYIPESAVEEAYLSGDLSESALKRLKKDTKYELALHIAEEN